MNEQREKESKYKSPYRKFAIEDKPFKCSCNPERFAYLEKRQLIRHQKEKHSRDDR